MAIHCGRINAPEQALSYFVPSARGTPFMVNATTNGYFPSGASSPPLMASAVLGSSRDATAVTSASAPSRRARDPVHDRGNGRDLAKRLRKGTPRGSVSPPVGAPGATTLSTGPFCPVTPATTPHRAWFNRPV
ncbi:hypothetical protein GCM10012275_04190 [Longimycelium tulufanense]|uniref:Uncharacterized protein n=1 Tax=Longimycelium tulufanense TaxID=907463 RepID=A0A8J3FSB2_9PSEU|nr:hypothetical protein GCM10012275_04190 [Longimycelium tulufanense]